MWFWGLRRKARSLLNKGYDQAQQKFSQSASLKTVSDYSENPCQIALYPLLWLKHKMMCNTAIFTKGHFVDMIPLKTEGLGAPHQISDLKTSSPQISQIIFISSSVNS